MSAIDYTDTCPAVLVVDDGIGMSGSVSVWRCRRPRNTNHTWHRSVGVGVTGEKYAMEWKT